MLLSFRIFDPRTRLRAPELREQGLGTWADLINRVAGGACGCACCWPISTRLYLGTAPLRLEIGAGFADGVQGDVQVLCAPHGQKAG